MPSRTAKAGANPLASSNVPGLSLPGSELVLLDALDQLAPKGAGRTGRMDADERMQTLVAALAHSSVRAGLDGQTGSEALAGQLAGISPVVSAKVLQIVLKHPALEKLWRRLMALQGDPPWLFHVRTDGSVHLVTLEEAHDHAPAALTFARSVSGTPTMQGVGFTLDATGGAQVTLDVVSGAEPTAQFGEAFTIPDAMCGLLLSASGSLKGSAAASVGGGATVGLGVGFNADASAALLYQFLRASSVVSALAHVRRDAPDPTSLRALHEHLDGPGVEGLRCAQLAIGAGGRIAISASLASSAASVASLKGPQGPMPVDLLQNLSASFSVAVGRSITRRLDASRHDDGRLLLAARHAQTRTVALDAALDMHVKVDGLDAWATAWLEQALPGVPQDLMDLLKRWSRPGKLLVAALKKRIGNPALRELAELLTGQATPASAATAVTNQLLAPIAEAFDTVHNLFDAAADAGDEVVAQVDAIVRARVDNDALADAIMTRLVQPVHGAWTGLLADLGDEVDTFWKKKVKAKSKAAIRKLLAPFSDALGIGKAAAEVGELVGQVHAQLARYGAWRAQLFEQVQRSLRGRIGFALSYSRRDAINVWLDRSYLLDLAGLSSDQDWADPQAGYEALLAGAAPQPAFGPQVPVDIVDEELGGSATTVRTVQLGLDLLSLSTAYTAVRKAGAQIIATPSGELRSASASLDNTETARTRKRNWTVRFAGLFNLADTAERIANGGSGTADDTPALPGGFEVDAVFAAATDAQVGDLFASLRRADALGRERLFRAGQLEALEAEVDAQRHGKSKIALRVSFGLLFPIVELDEFVAALDLARDQGRAAELLLAARRGAWRDPAPLDGAVEMVRDRLSDYRGRRVSIPELYHAFEPDRQARRRADLDIGRAGAGRSMLRVGSKETSVPGIWLSQLQKSVAAHAGLGRFLGQVGKLDDMVRETARAIASADTGAGRRAELAEGLEAMLSVQARANSALGFALDGSDTAIPGESLAPDTLALLPLVAEALAARGLPLQSPASNLRVWTAPAGDAVDTIAWKEL